MPQALNIRTGGKQDISFLMRCIRELADFERAPEAVEVDEVRLTADFEASAFAFLLAEWEGQPAAIALYYPRYSTWKGRCWYLEDLYVLPEFRNRGIGEALLFRLKDEALKAGALRLDWQVLDWNSEAVRFYERLGAEVEKEWWNCKWWLVER